MSNGNNGKAKCTPVSSSIYSSLASCDLSSSACQPCKPKKSSGSGCICTVAPLTTNHKGCVALNESNYNEATLRWDQSSTSWEVRPHMAYMNRNTDPSITTVNGTTTDYSKITWSGTDVVKTGVNDPPKMTVAAIYDVNLTVWGQIENTSAADYTYMVYFALASSVPTASNQGSGSSWFNQFYFNVYVPSQQSRVFYQDYRTLWHKSTNNSETLAHYVRVLRDTTELDETDGSSDQSEFQLNQIETIITTI